MTTTNNLNSFSLATKSRFDNAVSGQVFDGKSKQEWIQFCNQVMTTVHIGDSSKKVSWRIIQCLLGDKFIIKPDELGNIGNIIKMCFIKSPRFVRSQKRIKQVCSELLDLSFDFTVMWDVIAQGSSFCQKPPHVSSLHECAYFIIENFNYTIFCENSFRVRVIDWMTSNDLVPRLDLCLFELEDLNSMLLVIYEIMSETVNLSSQNKLKGLLKAFMFISKSNLPIVAQSGTCEKSGDASECPVVAHGWFDLKVSQNHEFNSETNILFKNLNALIGSVNQKSGAFSLKDSFTSLFNCFTGGVKVKFEGLDDLLDVVDKCVDGVKRALTTLLLYVTFRLLKLSGVFSDLVLSVLGSVLTVLGISALYGREIWIDVFERITKFVTFSDMVTVQAGYNDLSEPIEAFLALMQLSILGKAWYYEKDLLSAFKSSIGGWDKLKVDFSDSLATWFGIFQKFADWTCSTLKVKPWNMWTGKHPSLKRYVEETNNFLLLVQQDPTLTFDKGRVLERVLKIGRDALAELPVNAVHERNLLRSVTESLSLWKSKLGKANFLGSGPRVKPLGILFSGPSQVGKSEMNNVFCRLVAARVLPFERIESFVLNPSTEVYNRIIEQEFWDAWQNQSIVQIDELGGQKDVAGQNNEAFESIRLINGNNYSLHAADIESKGLINARPVMVAATTNMIRFDWNSINYPNAFNRRYEAYAAIPKREHLVNLDVDVFQYESVKMKELDEWYYKFEHLELWKYDLEKAKAGGSIQSAIVGGPISFDQLVEESVEKILKLQKKGQQILKMHDQIIKDELMKRPDAHRMPDLFEGIEEEVARYRASMDKINTIVCQGDFPVAQGNLKKKKSSTSFVLVAFATLALVQSALSVVTMAFGHEFVPKHMRRLRSYLPRIGYKFEAYFIYLTNKVTMKTTELTVETTTQANGIAKSVFGCGRCIVCKHKTLDLFDVYDFTKTRNLWPEHAKHIRDSFESHLNENDWDFEAGLALNRSEPWCLELKKSVWQGTREIPYSDGESYSYLIRGLLQQTVQNMAKSRFNGLHRKIECFFRLSQSGWYSFISNWKTTVPIVTALTTVSVIVYNFVSTVFPQSSSGKRGKSTIRRHKVKTQKLNRRVVTESAVDGIIDNVMNKVLSRNQYRIGVVGGMPMGLITMLGGNIGIMPMHFAEMLTYAKEEKNQEPWILSSVIANLDQKVEVPFSAFKFYDLEHDGCHDLIFFSIDIRYLAPSPNILKYFVAEDKCPKDKFYGALFVPRIVNSHIILSKEPGWVSPNVSISYTDANESLEKYVLNEAYQYYFQTDRGDCGSLLVRYSAEGNAERILGFHVSGSRFGVGYSQSLTSEVIKSGFDSVKANFDDYIESSDVPIDHDGDVVIQGFVNLGKINGPRAPEETKLVKTPLNNVVFECETAPAILKPTCVDGVKVDPMEIARNNYLTNSVHVGEKLLEQCVWSLVSDLTNKSVCNEHLVGPRDLTFEEACFGIDGQQFVNGVKRSTSPGFPRCKEKNSFPGSKKKWLGPFDHQDRPDDNNDSFMDVKRSVSRIISLAKQGCRDLHYCTDFPKDERRSKEKVLKLQTRFISGTSMDYGIVCLIKFGAICEWLLANRILNGMTVGINPFDDEWNTLAHSLKMTKCNASLKLYMDGDFKSFDAAHSRQLMYSFVELCDVFYKDHCLVRRVLLEDLFNSLHIYKGRVYLWTKSLPSGHPLTPVINCWVNLLLHKLAGVKSYCRVNNLKCNSITTNTALKLINQHVVTQVYGDDNLHYVDFVVQDWFNINEHIISMKELGYIYTDALKTGNVTEFLRWEEVSFLKRVFRRHEITGKIVAPLSLKTIRDMIQWTKKKDETLEDHKKTVQTALKELSFHDYLVFENYKNIIVSSCNSQLNWLPKVVDYETLFSMNNGRKEYL